MAERKDNMVHGVNSRVVGILAATCLLGVLQLGLIAGDHVESSDKSKVPADLIHWIRSVLGDDVETWWFDTDFYEKLDGATVFNVRNTRGESVVLLTNGSEVFRINCREGYLHANEVLRKLPFKREQFSDVPETHGFLQNVVRLCHGPGAEIMTSGIPELVEDSPLGAAILEQWVRGTEKDPNEFCKLCVDARITLAASKWTATFNVIKHDGSVDQWIVSGGFRGENHVEMKSLQIASIRGKGTFSWVTPLGGG